MKEVHFRQIVKFYDPIEALAKKLERHIRTEKLEACTSNIPDFQYHRGRLEVLEVVAAWVETLKQGREI